MAVQQPKVWRCKTLRYGDARCCPQAKYEVTTMSRLYLYPVQVEDWLASTADICSNPKYSRRLQRTTFLASWLPRFLSNINDAWLAAFPQASDVPAKLPLPRKSCISLHCMTKMPTVPQKLHVPMLEQVHLFAQVFLCFVAGCLVVSNKVQPITPHAKDPCKMFKQVGSSGNWSVGADMEHPATFG